jgi:hypothetical protein
MRKSPEPLTNDSNVREPGENSSVSLIPNWAPILTPIPFEPNLDGRSESVAASLQKPLAGPASIVQNDRVPSQITIRDVEVKRA